MKAGTSSITCGGGCTANMARSQGSEAMFNVSGVALVGATGAASAAAPGACPGMARRFSEIVAASVGAGQTYISACSSAAASGDSSRFSGKTVRRVAMTERSRAISGL